MSATLSPGRFSDAELDDIRERETVSSVFERFGLRLKRIGKGMQACICPWHAENTASCQINDAKGVFHCKGCSEGGNVFDAVMKLKPCKFPEAVEFLGGVRELTDADRAEIERRKRQREAQEAAEALKQTQKARRLWDQGRDIRGTHAFEYLGARGVTPHLAADLRFVPALPFWGLTAEDGEFAELGAFPAMLGAIRNAAGDLIGVHRTYLDPVEPAKLKPPGCRRANRAKKITGEQRCGSIRLSPPSERMAYGEGIETTMSWACLMQGAQGIGLAALVSLGNICGGSTQHKPHPTLKHPSGKPVLIPNGVPDFSKPGFVPPAAVREAILIGDGDSDAAGTKARLTTAGRRWANDPDRRAPMRVVVSMADDGFDFNDLWMREAEDF
jgi:hypothetical protein